MNPQPSYPTQHPPFNPQSQFPANQVSNGHSAPVNGVYGSQNGPQNSFPGHYQSGPGVGTGYQTQTNQPLNSNGNHNMPIPYSNSHGQQAVPGVQSPTQVPNYSAGFPTAPQALHQQPMKSANYASQYAPPPPGPPHAPIANSQYMESRDNGVTNDMRMQHQMPVPASGLPAQYAPSAHLPPQPHMPLQAPPHQMSPPQMQGQMAGGYYGGQQMQPQPQQRLDPDAMPSVVQVIQDDQEKYARSDNVIFATTIPATVPPLVTSIRPESVVHDGGSARPQHLTCSMYQVPTAEDILKATSIPLGIVIKPFDESEVDGNMTIPITGSEIIRCNRCRAYMSPYMRFVDGGRRFQCALCHHISDVSQTYYAHLDHMGQRLDRYERPELYLGSYEFKATSEFCRNSILNCRRPHIVFAFELTVNSLPIVRKVVAELPSIIREHLPVDPLRRGSPPPLVGFMTYNSKIQFYDVKGDGQAHVVCDVTQTFPPITSFLADPIEHADKIDR